MLFGRGRDGGGGSVTSADPFPLPVQLVPINPACCRRCELRRARNPPNLRPASPRVPSLLPKQKTIRTSAQTQNLSSNLSPNLPLLGHKVAAVPFASTIISRLPICSPGPSVFAEAGCPTVSIIVTSNVLGTGTGSMAVPSRDWRQEALTIWESTSVHQYVFHSRPAWFRPCEMLANISRYSLNARTRRSL